MRRLVCLLSICCLSTVWAQATGPVTIGSVTYDRVDPGPEFKEATRPLQNWTAPDPTEAEQRAGMMAYVASDPGAYRTYRVPKPTERVDRLRVFLAPGEDEPVCFAVYSLVRLPGLTVTADLKGAPLSVDVRQMHCWPQRTGWKSRQWYLTPELLLPCAGGRKMVPFKRGVLQEVPFDLGAGETQGFWLTLTAPQNAPAGRYEAQVTVGSTREQSLVLPLTIEVLPIKLRRPKDRSWLLYGDSGRWNRMSEAQILAELKDYRRHGMDGLIEGPMGRPDVSRLKQGQVTFDAGPYRRIAKLCEQAGMFGPHVIGSAGPELVCQALGIKPDLHKGEWPEEVKAGVRAIAKAALAATADLPSKWYYYGVDEPTGDNTYAIQDYQAWHDAGARTYATFYVPSFLEKASAYLTAPCFVVGLISHEQRAKEAREACAKTGAEFWWYGTGSYVNPFPQEGFMFHNRYGAGLLFWKSGARAEATWTFCRPHEDVFNDFDGVRQNEYEPKEQCTAYPQLLKPDDWSTYQGAIPTIAWESLREGVDDYVYLATLQGLITEALASAQPAVRQAATEAQTTLDGLVAGVPWFNPMGSVVFDTSRLQQVRRLVAERIVELQAVLDGRPVRAAAVAEQQFTLRVKVTEATRKSPLPVASVAGAAPAPTVDGNLDDAAWRNSANLAGFTDIRTGQPARLATSARVLSDDQALYVAIDCPEPAMREVAAPERQHDGPVWLEDSVEFFVAGAARQAYAHLIVTTANVVLDEANQDAQSWNPAVKTAVGRRADGWTVEMALPWTELAKAGVKREPVMAMNFGRSRYTAGDPQPHTAWSCTYDGFHVPSRFGIALLQQGAVALTGLCLPDQWGRQTLGVTLRCQSATPATAAVQCRGVGARQVALPAGGCRTVALPVSLRRPGRHEMALTWGAVDRPANTTKLVVETPEPATMAQPDGLLSNGAVVDLPVQLGLSAFERARHRLRVLLSNGCETHAASLRADTGGGCLPVTTRGPVRLRVQLVDACGRPVWQSPEHTLMVLPD